MGASLQPPYLISIFSWGAHGASWTREPHWTLQAVSAGWALWTFLTGSAFLASRSGGSLRSGSPWDSNGPSSTGRPPLPGRSRGAWRAGGAFTAFQSKRPHWTRKPSVPREAA